MRVALLSYNAQAGDAIGNQVAQKLAFFVECGAEVRVFVESEKRLHGTVRPYCKRLDRPEAEGEEWDYVSRADLVIVEFGQYYRLLGLLPLLAGGKPRLLFDYHGVTPPELWSKQNREALERGTQQRGLVWCTDAALAHSQFTARELREHTGFPAERCHVLGHPIDTRRFCPALPKHHLRDQLGLKEATLLLFVGRVAPNKRVPLLVEALDRLRDYWPPVHALIAGDVNDVYAAEARRCRQRAAELGLANRLHFLGHVAEDRLADIYRSADVFVMPSRHEGFCIPLLEAMACGIPVVAARAGALPETIGSAGLTFTPDDADDLAQQLRRIVSTTQEVKVTPSPCPLATVSPCQSLRVAVVSVRYGPGVVGGAETSLRTMATVLQEAGHHLEVFTSCTASESHWINHLREGTTQIDGIPVHRFRVDPHDRAQHLASVRAILQAEEPVSEEEERRYLAYSVHSTALFAALRHRRDQFDAILVGPYLFGLTADVARAFPDKTLLVPCFHDEPFARLQVWRQTYERVGGILYHSSEEQALAETVLGLNHPGGIQIDTAIDVDKEEGEKGTRGETNRSASPSLPFSLSPTLPLIDRPYLVYCGRYSVQKNLSTLLEYCRRYDKLHPGRFRFVFLGQGEVAIPIEPWARDLGFVNDESKRQILAGAAALVQLSHYESLSLVALEAWAQGTPVIADKRCRVLEGHLQRCRGGQAVGSFDEFRAALDDLWVQPQRWTAMGQSGREYVRKRFGSRAQLGQRLEKAIRGLKVPLAQRMRHQGLVRAAAHDNSEWKKRFSGLIESLLNAPFLPHQEAGEVRPRSPTRTVAVGADCVLVPAWVMNWGTHPFVDDGPVQAYVRCEIVGSCGEPLSLETPLPALVLPGKGLTVAVRVPVPPVSGSYQARFSIQAKVGQKLGWRERDQMEAVPRVNSCGEMFLVVEDGVDAHAGNCCQPLLDAVQAALTEAERRRRLPDDYIDVTEGILAGWKRRLKRKLLGNFKHAYVDVLSRQQSAFNRHILAALQELAECTRLLDHSKDSIIRSSSGTGPTSLAASIEQAVAAGKTDELAVWLQGLVDQLAENRRRCAALEARLDSLETKNPGREETRL